MTLFIFVFIGRGGVGLRADPRWCEGIWPILNPLFRVSNTSFLNLLQCYDWYQTKWKQHHSYWRTCVFELAEKGLMRVVQHVLNFFFFAYLLNIRFMHTAHVLLLYIHLTFSKLLSVYLQIFFLSLTKLYWYLDIFMIFDDNTMVLNDNPVF